MAALLFSGTLLKFVVFFLRNGPCVAQIVLIRAFLHWETHTGNRLCITLRKGFVSFNKTESFFKKKTYFLDFKQMQILF